MAGVGDKEIEERKGQEGNQADVDTESTELDMAEEAALAETGQKFVQRLRPCNWG